MQCVRPTRKLKVLVERRFRHPKRLGGFSEESNFLLVEVEISACDAGEL